MLRKISKSLLVYNLITFGILLNPFLIEVTAQTQEELNQALYDASEGGEIETVKQLIAKGADLNVQMDCIDLDRTPLMGAACYNHSEIVKLLIKKGAEVDLRNDVQDYTALMFAAERGRLETAKILIEKGADVNFQNVGGITALINASYYGHLDMVKLLIENGADVNAKDGDGDSALSFAEMRGYTEVANLLKKTQSGQLTIAKNGNLRSGPSESEEIIGKVTVGQEVLQLEESSAWHKIKLPDGKVGWIHQILLTKRDTETDKNMSKLGPLAPVDFSPISVIMNDLFQVASATHCLIMGDSTSTSWHLVLNDNTDILEYSRSKNGLGKPNGSVIYFDEDGGMDPIIGKANDESGNSIRPKGKNLIMKTHQLGASYSLSDNTMPGEYGPMAPMHLTVFLGMGTTVRFPSDMWIQFGDKQYKNGGFNITSNSIEFLSETEVKSDIGVFKLHNGQWRQISSQ